MEASQRGQDTPYSDSRETEKTASERKDQYFKVDHAASGSECESIPLGEQERWAVEPQKSIPRRRQ